MLYHFRDRFPQLGPTLDKYAHYQQRAELPAKTTLLEEGKISRQYILIEQGCVRSFFNDKGTDQTVQFFFENEGLSSLDSFVNDTPSAFSIETIEPSVIWTMPKKHALDMIEELTHHPSLVKMLLKIFSMRQTHYTNEFVSLIRETPEERYQKLLKDRPHVVQRIPQHYIASYLGVSSVHLSRIKSKLANGNAHF